MNNIFLLAILVFLLFIVYYVKYYKVEYFKSTNSKWASKNLKYKAYNKGNTIMDFSCVGYMGGKSIPDISVKINLKPTGKDDDTQIIQDAIDELSNKH